MVRVATRNESRKACREAADDVGPNALKSMNSLPKLNTVLLSTLSNSATGHRRTRSLNLNSRDTFRSKINCPGPVPALRGRFPAWPIVGKANGFRIEASIGWPGLRHFSKLRSPVKIGRSLPTSSRFRSAPPIEILKGAPEARRRIGAMRRLPRDFGALNVPEKAKR